MENKEKKMLTTEDLNRTLGKRSCTPSPSAM